VSADPAAALSGVVTFLFTDVEGSTGRWEADAEGMRAALAAHDEVLHGTISPRRWCRRPLHVRRRGVKPVGI
jgi:class 3 adenylate cyclase